MMPTSWVRGRLGEVLMMCVGVCVRVAETFSIAEGGPNYVRHIVKECNAVIF